MSSVLPSVISCSEALPSDRLGDPLLDDYLEFLAVRCRPNSVLAARRISKSNEFVRSEVHLIRLVNGEVPPYPIWITGDRIDWTLLENVVESRQPDLMRDVTRLHGLKPSDLDQQLHFWARVLRDVAGDFLAGDFAPLDEAAAIVRARVADHPQSVQVRLPDDAPTGDEAQEAAATAATVPPEVGVSVRRYRRRPRG